MHTPDTRQPWEAPSVTDIDLSENTLGGNTTYTDETAFPTLGDNFPAYPPS